MNSIILKGKIVGLLCFFTTFLSAQDLHLNFTSSWHVCTDGTLESTGYRFVSEKDSIVTDSFPVFTDVGKAVVMTAGVLHSVFALTEDSTVWAWGENQGGSLGLGDTIRRKDPDRIPGLSRIVQVKGEWFTYFALTDEGEVFAWGVGDNGQIGDSLREFRATPAKIPGLTEVISLSASMDHVLVVKRDGRVWAWGFNDKYQLGDGTNSLRPYPVLVPGLNDVVKVVAGYDHSLALKKDGSLWGWGNNYLGSLGDSTLGILVTIPTQIGAIDSVGDIGAGNNFSVVVRKDGQVWGFGLNSQGQLGIGNTGTFYKSPVKIQNLENIRSVLANQSFAFGQDNFGNWWGWGSNQYGQLGNGTRATQYYPVKFLSSCSGTSIEEANESILVDVFPNPSDGIFSVSAKNAALEKLRVYNSLGMPVVFQFRNGLLDISAHPKGLYYLEVQTGRRIYGTKLLLN